MKKLILLLSILVAGRNNSMAQDYDDPGAYLGVINQQSENIAKKFLRYTSAVAHGKREKKIEDLRMKLLDEVQESRMNIASLPSFKGDKAFRDTAVNFMKLYYNILNEDYSKIINLQEIAEQSYDDMEAYLLAQEMVAKKLDESNATMREAQRQFALRNNIRLTESQTEIGDMMKKVREINVYYHQLYLVFFKPYKQEYYLMEALSKNNMTGVEQNKSALLRYAEEGLVKLAAMNPYGDDRSLLDAAQTVLTFYVREVKEFFGKASDHLLASDKFETIKKEFEKKSSPTEKEIEAYNNAVNEVNASGDAYNRMSRDMNKSREQALNQWQKTVNEFFDRHTPRY